MAAAVTQLDADLVWSITANVSLVAVLSKCCFHYVFIRMLLIISLRQEMISTQTTHSFSPLCDGHMWTNISLCHEASVCEWWEQQRPPCVSLSALQLFSL